MILEALESFQRSSKTEEIRIPRDLTIEHLLPRQWERHWPLEIPENCGASEKKEAAENRDLLIDTFGNLTLLTKELNPAVSNGAWERKKIDILKHSALNLNRQLPENWNAHQILLRSDKLHQQAVAIWPRASMTLGAAE